MWTTCAATVTSRSRWCLPPRRWARVAGRASSRCRALSPVSPPRRPHCRPRCRQPQRHPLRSAPLLQASRPWPQQGAQRSSPQRQWCPSCSRLRSAAGTCAPPAAPHPLQPCPRSRSWGWWPRRPRASTAAPHPTARRTRTPHTTTTHCRPSAGTAPTAPHAPAALPPPTTCAAGGAGSGAARCAWRASSPPSPRWRWPLAPPCLRPPRSTAGSTSWTSAHPAWPSRRPTSSARPAVQRPRLPISPLRITPT
mmetsp:Transcript_37844/g.95706  ORF Transcript_37844/g.95706 Transcript_37844/m.95706 type:complete len:252 (-) Transcript_37844:668-1423(-)